MAVFFKYFFIGTFLFVSSVCAEENLSVTVNNTENTEQKSDNLALVPADNSREALTTGVVDDLKDRADKGDVSALLDLGYMYLYGINGVNIDYKQALQYYEKASSLNSAVAYNNLGSLYFSGIGTDVDKKKALLFFEEAAKLGSNDAAVNLAIISLSSGPQGKTEEDYNKIFSLLKQAQKDNNIAKFLLGYSYAKGFRVEPDKIKAFKNIKAAADDKYDEAQCVLADFYIKGFGTAKNYNRAVEYLQLAVDQGNKEAMVKLADILAQGKLYTKDIKKAHILYNVASVLGAKDAAEKRDALEDNLAIQDLLSIQSMAEDFSATPSPQTSFIRQTFGNSLKAYIDAYIVPLDSKTQKGEQVN